MILLGVFLHLVAFCHCAKILAVFNHPGYSHTYLGKVLLKHLARRGHQITMVSAYPMDEPIPNYRDIHLTGILEDLHRREMMYFTEEKSDELAELRNMTMTHTEMTFANPEVKDLLHSNATFDLVIIDWFYNEAVLVFGHVFKAPVVLMCAFGNNILMNEYTGNSLPFAWVPGAALPIMDDMSFKYRVIMTAINILVPIFGERRKRNYEELLKKHFDDPPRIDELNEKVALVLAYSHFSFETPRPYTPNIIPVGGLHIEETKELQKEVKEFLESAKDGAIYFSLGSQVKSANLDKDKLKLIIKALARLPQKILWKYERDDLTDLPPNIKILKWLSQRDVLAHPKIKLFISHGGTVGVTEGIHFHVPFLCIPFIGDQVTNSAFIVSRGFGLKINAADITEEVFHSMIIELLTNSTYQERANYFSSLLREQPISPLNNAIYWVEHVLKYKGAPHLRTFALELPWYKNYLLDVIAFFALVFWIIYKVLKFFVKQLFAVILKATTRRKEKTN